MWIFFSAFVLWEVLELDFTISCFLQVGLFSCTSLPFSTLWIFFNMIHDYIFNPHVHGSSASLYSFPVEIKKYEELISFFYHHQMWQCLSSPSTAALFFLNMIWFLWIFLPDKQFLLRLLTSVTRKSSHIISSCLISFARWLQLSSLFFPSVLINLFILKDGFWNYWFFGPYASLQGRFKRNPTSFFLD